MQRDREVEVMHGPPTLASPTGQSPPPGRGPLFFIALIVLLLLAIAGGALVVLFVVARDRSPASAAAPDASAVSVAVTSAASTGVAASASAPAVHDAGAPAAHVPAIPPVHSAAPIKAGSEQCMCRATSGARAPLCSTAGPGTCKCKDAVGHTLCKVATPQWCPEDQETYASPTAKDNDPCSGFSASDPQPGRLYACAICASMETYTGREGTACTGFRGDRTPAAGTVDCSNLDFDCKRGVATACAAYASHK